LEYRLLDESGEFISEEWSVLDDSLELAKDRVYTMQVRLVATDDALASDFAELTIDTHKVKVPFSLKRLLSVGFLLFVGGILLIATILMCIILIKAKRRAEKEELGG